MTNNRVLRSILLLCIALAFTLLSSLALAEPRELSWDDLIPLGIPYSEIIGEGEIDEEADTWNPIYDENGSRLNSLLDGEFVKIPGFVVPLETDANGIHSFILVPYMGACLHTPPPPPNQLVLVHTPAPWNHPDPWQPIWVIGKMRTQMQSNDIAETGYAIAADGIAVYEWEQEAN